MSETQAMSPFDLLDCLGLSSPRADWWAEYMHASHVWLVWHGGGPSVRFDADAIETASLVELRAVGAALDEARAAGVSGRGDVEVTREQPDPDEPPAYRARFVLWSEPRVPAAASDMCEVPAEPFVPGPGFWRVEGLGEGASEFWKVEGGGGASVIALGFTQRGYETWGARVADLVERYPDAVWTPDRDRRLEPAAASATDAAYPNPDGTWTPTSHGVWHGVTMRDYRLKHGVTMRDSWIEPWVPDRPELGMWVRLDTWGHRLVASLTPCGSWRVGEEVWRLGNPPPLNVVRVEYDGRVWVREEGPDVER